MKASEAGKVECVKVLLDRGAQVIMQEKVSSDYTCNAVCTQSPQ